ncbi:MAG: hypothetical protein MJH09_05785 [Cetobacterium sp.]|nr:hypothetical protein [Cetobacterium sp.]
MSTSKKEPNYNSEGVDLNIYTVRRCDEIEEYADILDYIKGANKAYYNMITTMIEMCYVIKHDIKDFKHNGRKNRAIRNISLIENKRHLDILKGLSEEFLSNEYKKIN